MAITLPYQINNISNSAVQNISGVYCISGNVFDANYSALANPVNPLIPVAGNISLTTNNSGNIYELNNPASNTTISLPSPTNGFNCAFVGNNTSSYTYTLTTLSGVIKYTTSQSSSSVVIDATVGKRYILVSDGTNYYLFKTDNNLSNVVNVTGPDLTMSGNTGSTISNATLATTGVTAGTYGNSTQVPQITVDAKGRATSVSNISIAFPSTNISVTGGDLTMSGNTGTAITNATLATTGVTAGTYGSATQVPQITVDAKGRATSITNLNISYPSTSISVTGSDLTLSGNTGTAITNATLATTGVTAGTYGSSTQVPQITIDAKGRATSAGNVNIAFPSTSISVTGSDLTMSGTTGTAITNATLATTGVTCCSCTCKWILCNVSW